MRAYRRLCHFVDWDLSKTGYVRSGAWSIAIALAVVTLPLPILRVPYEGGEVALLAVTAGLAVAWLSFVAWRGWRLIRAGSARSDHAYDCEGKFKLPPEYAASESATRAAHRRDIPEQP